MKMPGQNRSDQDWPSSILVVEDDQLLLKLLGEFLSALSINHTLAQTGSDAIEILKKEFFPLVFTDIKMPDFDGMQVIAHIQSRYPETDVVAMTGYSHDYGLVDVIRAGACDYMTKPFSFDEFKAKIKRITRERCLLQHLQQEIAKYRHSETDLNRQKDTLLEQVRQQKDELFATNSALRILLRQRDMEKNDLVNTLTRRFYQEIVPYLEKLKITPLQESQKYILDVLTVNLEKIFIQSTPRDAFRHTPFTETETRIVNLIKQQKTSKEIARILQVSSGTIRTHRENIRKKLQITNTKKSLYKTILSIL